VLDAAEGRHDRTGREAAASRQHRHVARSVRQERREVTVDLTRLDERPPATSHDEVDVVLGREERGLAPAVVGGVDRDPGRDTALSQALSALRERGSSLCEAGAISEQADEYELASGRSPPTPNALTTSLAI